MKKILHVLRCFSNGGTEKYVINLFKETYKDYDNYLLVFEDIQSYEELLNDMEIKIIKIDNLKNSNLITFMKNIRKIIHNNKIDIVYSYTHYNSGIISLCAFLEGVKTRITHSHRSSSEQKLTFKYSIYRFISKLLINTFTTEKLACSNEAGKDLFFGKFNLINNGIEIDKYKYNDTKRSILRKKLNISNDDVVVGMIGRLDDNKNNIFMINVIKDCYKLNSNIKLILIGDGPKKEFLKKYVIDNKIENNVLILGNKEDANDYYNVFDLFCITSLYEGLPYVLIEAQTNGLICLASDTVDKLSNVTNNVRFLSLKDKDNWIKFLNSNIIERKDCVSKIIESGFSLKHSVREVVNIYEK